MRIGNEGENNVECIEFVLPERCDGCEVFLHFRTDDNVDVVKLGADRTFIPTRRYMVAGKYIAFIEALGADDMVWRSNRIAFTVGALPFDAESEVGG